MARRVDHYLCRGGLDLISGPLTVKPGRLWTSQNYMPSEGGYERIPGYERYDGRPSPSDAEYWILGFDGDPSSPPAVGATITGGTSGATGVVLAIAGADYVLGEVDEDPNEFEDDESLGTAGTVNGVTRQLGADTLALDLDYRTLAATQRRNSIAAVPGSGQVRGVWVFKNKLYAVRDNAGASAGVMHVESDMGWTPVTAFTLPAGGRYEFINHNFLGQADTIEMYGVNGVGKAFHYDGATFTEISTAQPTDTPTHIGVHREHLLLAYPGGSLVVSGTGLPDNYTAAEGAAEIAGGQDILGLKQVGSGNTLIVGEDHMSVLYGNDSQDFQLADHSDPQTGGVEWTLQSVGGPLYMDNRGVRRFDATTKYGNFVINTMTSDVQPWINLQREERNVPISSMRVRARDQYRVFFNSGIGLIVYVGRKYPEVSLIDYGVAVRCSVSSEDDDRIERVYFGSDDGWVFEAERGRSFDGNEIEAYCRLPLNNVGMPARWKRFIKADIHLDLDSEVKMGVSALYNDGEHPSQLNIDETIHGGGGLFDEAAWDEFYYDSPLNGYGSYDLTGVGRNCSLLFLSKTDREASHILNGISLHYATMRRER